jgi:hypothetical protein
LNPSIFRDFPLYVPDMYCSTQTDSILRPRAAPSHHDKPVKLQLVGAEISERWIAQAAWKKPDFESDGRKPDLRYFMDKRLKDKVALRTKDVTLIKCRDCGIGLYAGYARAVMMHVPTKQGQLHPTASTGMVHKGKPFKMYVVEAGWRVVSERMKQEGAQVRGVEGDMIVSEAVGIEGVVCLCPGESCGRPIGMAVKRGCDDSMKEFVDKMLLIADQVDAEGLHIVMKRASNMDRTGMKTTVKSMIKTWEKPNGNR